MNTPTLRRGTVAAVSDHMIVEEGDHYVSSIAAPAEAFSWSGLWPSRISVGSSICNMSRSRENPWTGWQVLSVLRDRACRGPYSARKPGGMQDHD